MIDDAVTDRAALSTSSPEVLWTPDSREAGNSAVAAFARQVRERYGVAVADTDYAALHAWSVEDIEGFWSTAADFLGVDAVPRTLSGKKLEVPVKKILAGVAPDAAVSRDALRDPDALAPFLDLARSSAAAEGHRP